MGPVESELLQLGRRYPVSWRVTMVTIGSVLAPLVVSGQRQVYALIAAAVVLGWTWLSVVLRPGQPERLLAVDVLLVALACLTMEHTTRLESQVDAAPWVDVKWYLKREGVIDLNATGAVDHCLVLAGPKSPAVSSVGGLRPMVIDAVYLFDPPELVTVLRERGRNIGTATSVRAELWSAAEIYPGHSARFPLTTEQRAALARFGSSPQGGR